MNNEKSREKLKKEVIGRMIQAFGPDENLLEEKYSFDGWEQKEIAGVLDVDEAQISRVLKKPGFKADKPLGIIALSSINKHLKFYLKIKSREERIEELERKQVAQEQEINTLSIDNSELSKVSESLKAEKEEFDLNSKSKNEIINDLEKQMEGLNSENRNLKTGENRFRAITQYLMAGFILLLVLTLVSIFWLPSKLNDVISSREQAKSDDYIISNGVTLDKIMSMHGQIMSNSLALEALILNSRVKNSKSTFTNIQKEKLITDAKDGIERIIKKGRITLSGIGFVTSNGINIAEILEEVAPHDSLFSNSTSLFTGPLESTIPLLLSKEASFQEIVKEIRETSEDVQIKTWSDMRNVMELSY